MRQPPRQAEPAASIAPSTADAPCATQGCWVSRAMRSLDFERGIGGTGDPPTHITLAAFPTDQVTIWDLSAGDVGRG